MQIKGQAEITDDPSEVQKLGEELWRRYSDGGELSEAVRAMMSRKLASVSPSLCILFKVATGTIASSAACTEHPIQRTTAKDAKDAEAESSRD